jgi:hypothetical protein
MEKKDVLDGGMHDAVREYVWRELKGWEIGGR